MATGSARKSPSTAHWDWTTGGIIENGRSCADILPCFGSLFYNAFKAAAIGCQTVFYGISGPGSVAMVSLAACCVSASQRETEIDEKGASSPVAVGPVLCSETTLYPPMGAKYFWCDPAAPEHSRRQKKAGQAGLPYPSKTDL